MILPAKINILVLLLSVSFAIQLKAGAVSDTLRVGFVGVHTEQVGERYYNEIDRRYFRQIERNDRFEIVRVDPQEPSESLVMEEHILRGWVPGLAENRNLKYLIGGRLRHMSDEDPPGLLYGKIFRYDRDSDRFNFLNVNRSYIDFDSELVRYNNQFIDTIPIPEVSSRSQKIVKWSLIVLGSAAVVTGAIYLYNSVESSGGGGSPEPRPTPFY